MAKLFGYAQVEHVQTRRADSGIYRIEAVVAGVTPAQRAAEAPPAGQRQSCVRDNVRRAVDVLSLSRRRIVFLEEVIAEEGVGHFRHSGVEAQETCQSQRGLYFEAVGAA